MRIRSVNIESFGRIRGWRCGFGDGVTVISGDNEAGKTTVMEFVRGTLFPVNSRKLYPVPAKSDAGRVSVVMDDGSELAFVRDHGKTRAEDGGPMPEELTGLDAATYRSMFAMSLEDLVNDEVLKSGDIRSRFLTVPGGDRLPAVLADISKEMEAALNSDRISDRKGIGMLMERGRVLDEEIEKTRALADRYDELSAEREVLKTRAAEADKAREESQRRTAELQVILSQRGNAKDYRELAAKIPSLEGGRAVPEGADAEYSRLKTTSETASQTAETAEAAASEGRRDLHGGDPSIIMAKRDEITQFTTGASDHRDTEGRIGRLTERRNAESARMYGYMASTGMTPETATQADIDGAIREAARIPDGNGGKRTALPTALMAVGAVAAAGLSAGYALTQNSALLWAAIGGAALAIAGAALAAAKGRGRATVSAWDPGRFGLPATATPDRLQGLKMEAEAMAEAKRNAEKCQSDIDGLKARVTTESGTLAALCAATGVSGGDSFEKGLENLRRALITSKSACRDAQAAKSAHAKATSASEAVARFLEPYGSESGFLDACAERDELKSIETRMESLRAGMEASSGMGIGELLAFLDEHGDAPARTSPSGDASGDVRTELGRIESDMGHILADGELDALLADKSENDAVLAAEIRRWGVLSLARGMSDTVCDDFYSSMQPSVVRRANEYLGLMTSGRYSMASDPRDSEIVVVDTDSEERKGARQWSSGLGDQVHLSIKMAMAKEMGSERLPLILDDVLVRFDRTRRSGACKAITRFAEDQQVLVFTCDSTMYDSFAAEGDPVRVDIGSKIHQ